MNENNAHSLIEELYKPLTSRKNNLIYKTYIYNLFRYNQDNRKKSYERNNKEKKFNACIKCINSPVRHNSKKSSSFHLNTYYRNKKSNFTPKNLKKININNTNKIRYPNYFSENKKTSFLKNNINENNYISRNIKINKNFTSLYGLLDNSKKFIYKNLNDENLILRPILRNNNNKAELLKKNITENILIDNNKLKKDENNKGIKNDSIYSKNKINNILNKTHNNIISPPSTNQSRKGLKITLMKDFNDMQPRNRFNILRKELLEKDIETNKMLMKFQKNTKKNLLKKWFKLINNNLNKNKNYCK